MTEKNAHFTGKLKSSMVTGQMFAVCPTKQLWGGGLRAPSGGPRHMKKSQRNGTGRQKWRRGGSFVENTCHKSRKSRFFEEEENALEERKGSKVKKRIITLVSGIQKRKKMDLVTSLSLWFLLLKMLSDKNYRWLFRVTDCKRIRISGIIVRLENEKHDLLRFFFEDILHHKSIRETD